jgi:NADH-quinone oxidoreductase subunit G
MCDEGRFGYPSINDNRLLHPMVRQGEGLVQTNWSEAIQRASAALQQHSGDAVAIIVAPQGTNEDCALLTRLAADVLGTSRVCLYQGEPGYEDDLLMRADKNPNTHGARDMGLPEPTSTEGLATLVQAIEQGAVKVLYAIDTDLSAAFGAETFSRLLAHLDCVIVQGSNTWPGCEQAHIVLPSATYAERDGTFTNFQGRVQRLNVAFAPRGEARPAWQIYQQLANGCGQTWTYPSAEAILAEVAATIPAYQGLSYAKVGDCGQQVT